MTLPETKWFMKKKVFIVQVIIYLDVHYPLRNFEKHNSTEID